MNSVGPEAKIFLAIITGLVFYVVIVFCSVYFGSTTVFSKLLVNNIMRMTIRPKGHVMIITTSWRSCLLLLGFASRYVEINPNTKTVRIRLRKFWILQTSRRIQYNWISRIEYNYEQLSITFLQMAYHENDLFTVSLIMKNGERVVLAHFLGSGDFTRAWGPNFWAYWDDYFWSGILKGNQEDTSATFVRAVENLIGVPVERG